MARKESFSHVKAAMWGRMQMGWKPSKEDKHISFWFHRLNQESVVLLCHMR